ncbi:MAG: ATP-binding protein [Chitinophagales bacterium]
MNRFFKNARLFILVAALVSDINARGQHYLDSLIDQLHSEKTDTGKVYILGAISSYYSFTNFDSSLYFANQAEKLALSSGFYFGNQISKHGLYLAYLAVGNYPKCLEIAIRNLNLAEQLQDRRDIGMGVAYAQLAQIHRLNQDANGAVLNARRSITLLENAPIPFNTFLSSAYTALGITSVSKNMPDSILYYLKKAYQVAHLENSVSFLAMVTVAFMGDGFSMRNEFQKAKDYYFEALKEGIYTNNPYIQSRVLQNLADLNYKMGFADSGIFYAQQSIRISTKFGFVNYSMNSYTFLAKYYETIQQHDSSFKYMKLTLSTKDTLFSQARMQQFILRDFNEKQRQQDLELAKAKYATQLRLYGLISALSILIFLAIFLYRNNLQRKKTNDVLSHQKADLETALGKLKSTQSQLIQAEKMASLGELSAGIAHEIQNPLNFVNNFSEINMELAAELKQELNKLNIDKTQLQDCFGIISNIIQNQEKINQHGSRADSIVKGMMQHMIVRAGQKEITDINKLVEEYLRLSYQAFYAREKSFNVMPNLSLDKSLEKMNLAPQDLGKALLNLFNNAFYYMSEKQKGDSAKEYVPILNILTRNLKDQVEIRIKDNGSGISPKLVNKIFQPFFTTKPTGQGTGLGLSLAYDIVTKEHGGTIVVDSKEGEYTEFIIHLPLNNKTT